MKIAVVGSVNMDMIVHTERIPLKGETIEGSRLEYQPGGKGANQAVAMAKLGADVRMFGCVGDDSTGIQLVKNMQESGVDVSFVRRNAGCISGQALITVGGGDNTIVILSGANRFVDLDYVKEFQEEILEADMIVLQNEIPGEAVEYLIGVGSERGKMIIWNPAPARAVNRELIDKISYLTPNEHEARIIFQEEDVEKLLKDYPEKLIVTQGEAGVSLGLADGRVVNVPAKKVVVKDTTGAGDTFNGAFCVGLARRMDRLEALAFANAAAGLAVQKVGAQRGMPTLEEVHSGVGTPQKSVLPHRAPHTEPFGGQAVDKDA